jgi:hypothetical protein
VEGRPSSTILAVEGNWQSKKEIVQHLQATRSYNLISVSFFDAEAENCNQWQR